MGQGDDGVVTSTANGRSEVPVGWKLVPVEPTDEMLDAYWDQSGESEIMRSRVEAIGRRYYRAMLEVSPPPPAGAAGGSSGDLGALSAGATQGQYIAKRYDDGACGAYIECDGMQISASMPEEDALYLAEAGNAYRSGRLIEAPTPDLGAQGEPVAQGTLADEPYDPLKAAVWQALTPFMVEMMQTGGVTFMGLRNAVVAAVRPLYAAPAAPRTGSGVSVEEIARAIADELGYHYDPSEVDFDGCQSDPKPDDWQRTATRIHALFAQAPRDGG